MSEQDRDESEALVSSRSSSGRSLAAAELFRERPTRALASLLPHFLLSLASPRTRVEYQRNLRDYLTWCDAQGIPVETIDDVTEASLNLWLHALKRTRRPDGKLLEPCTVAAKLAAVTSLTRWAWKRRLIPENPGAFLERPSTRRVRGKTEAIPEDVITEVLKRLATRTRVAEAQGLRAYRAAFREYVVFATLCSVGMRASELAGLRMADLELSGSLPRLHMTLKGGDRNSPAINDELAALLKTYVERCRAGASPNDPLFAGGLSAAGETLHRTSISRLVSRLVKEVGGEHVSAHSCRAAVASMLHKRGVPVGDIQELLGHKSITTTQLYLKNMNEAEDAAARRLNLFKGDKA